jgi:uncharacterized protein (UPF0216 family)
MNTIILQNRPRKTAQGNTFTIEVIGDSPVKEAIKASIAELEHHPAKAHRRSIIDMLSLIEKHNMQIRFTEHYFTSDDLEAWLFVLQG